MLYLPQFDFILVDTDKIIALFEENPGLKLPLPRCAPIYRGIAAMLDQEAPQYSWHVIQEIVGGMNEFTPLLIRVNSKQSEELISK